VLGIKGHVIPAAVAGGVVRLIFGIALILFLVDEGPLLIQLQFGGSEGEKATRC
jgi:hypothetical protein